MSPPLPPFPGAIGASHLRVYDSVAPDGLRGGTPHVHLACTEAYWVVAGEGRVQTLGPQGFRETPLAPRRFVWFTPGTIHRLVNDDGRLEILVLMQNEGLPEAGDMVITFADGLLAEPERYRAAHALPAGETTTASDGEGARRRRDRGVEGFLALKEAVEARGSEALEAFYGRAAAIVGPDLPRWRKIWEDGPLAAATRTGDQLDALARGDATHLQASSVHVHPEPGAERRMGCCGTLGVYVGDEA